MDLNYTIGADASNFNQNVQGLAGTAQRASNEVSQSLAQASQATDRLGGSAMSASMRFQTMRSGLSAARDGMLAFAVGGQRADMMLMAMGHHITSLYNETGSMSGAFKALGSALLGPGGVILGLTVAYEVFKHFSKAQSEAYDSTKNFSDAQDAQKQVITNLDTSYAKAVSDVQELTTNIKLAKEGFINKNEVVKEYNDTLGKTMGAVKTLNEVEAKLVAGAPDYIKMMLYKAAAQTALKEASDKAIEAAKVELKPTESFGNFFDKIPVQNMSAADVNASKKNVDISNKAAKDEAKKKFENDQNDLLKIFNDFQAKAAKISEEHKWTFIDPEKTKTLKTAKDGLALLQKELKDAETALENSVFAGKTNAEDVDSPLARRVSAASEAIRKFKSDIDSVLGGIGANNTTTEDSIKSVKPKVGDLTSGYTPGVIQGMQAQVKAFTALNIARAASTAGTKNYNAALKEENLAGKEIVRTFGQGLMGAFQSALSGTQSFVSAMAGFLVQLIEKLIAAAAAAAILAALLSVTGFTELGSFSSIFGSLSGLTGILGSSSGGASALPAHANGGIFTTAHAGIFGEAGPEAIVTPKHLQDFAGVSGNNSNGVHITFDPIMTGPILNYKARVRSDKYIKRTS
jgi:hypothetical protein